MSRPSASPDTGHVPGTDDLRPHASGLSGAVRPGPRGSPHRFEARPRRARPRGAAMPDGIPQSGDISDLERLRAREPGTTAGTPRHRQRPSPARQSTHGRWPAARPWERDGERRLTRSSLQGAPPGRPQHGVHVFGVLQYERACSGHRSVGQGQQDQTFSSGPASRGTVLVPSTTSDRSPPRRWLRCRAPSSLAITHTPGRTTGGFLRARAHAARAKTAAALDEDQEPESCTTRVPASGTAGSGPAVCPDRRRGTSRLGRRHEPTAERCSARISGKRL
ncbi:hypothetical protein SATRM34S_06897 [Streptomyces atroolivaceus]